LKCETRYGEPNKPVSSLTVTHESMTCNVDGRVNQFSHEFTEVFWDLYTFQLETFAFKALPATGAGNYITTFVIGFRRVDWCTTIQTHSFPASTVWERGVKTRVPPTLYRRNGKLN
jgi:hypothetical protein